MDALILECHENNGFDRHAEPVEMGVPLARGQLSACNSLELLDPETGTQHPCQARPLMYWPDGSIRWLALNTLLDMEAGSHRRLKLALSGTPGAQEETLTPSLSGTSLVLETGRFRLELAQNSPEWRVYQGEQEAVHQLQMKDEDGALCEPHTDQPWQVIRTGHLCTVFGCQGHWQSPQGKSLARFRCRITAYRNCEKLRVEVAIHNPQRAIHPNGLWDLGDQGAIRFRSLTLTATHKNPTDIWLSPEPQSRILEQSGDSALYLYQDSSGGDNWNSRNHIDAQGKLTTRFPGYRVYGDSERLAVGQRAQPTTGFRTAGMQVSAALENFWQNFPSALGYRDQALVVGLFPEDSANCHELQGGERKTQVAWFHYGNRNNALSHVFHPLRPQVSSLCYEQTRAFPWFAAAADKTPLDELIQDGLDPERGFMAKREIIDEYGWRNFGDIFADHESLYLSPDQPPFISHYNNQYDAIYGFARQFALTGNPGWFRLMDDLARHVADIDIYHTEADRNEYNGGLFWHTDHYLDACTATHRTYSRHNPTSSIPGQTGGGPAAEHCYSTGLLYHHLLTGNPESREAVLELAHWIRSAHEGKGGLLEQLLALKKHDLPALKKLLRGQSASNQIYPFTRGTGNYINTLLDAHLLEPEEDWLNQAETVIRGTIHPEDRIEDRNLLNAETGWSYLVLLTALARYLVVKAETGCFDASYQYTRASFRHYTRWMLDHERPFLEAAESLEFANHTWVAQDIRKAMLMYQARWFDPELEFLYLEKASEWLKYVCQTLEQSPERAFARIQVILLQNHGPDRATFTLPPEAVMDTRYGNTSHEPPGPLTWPTLLKRIVRRICRGLWTFRPARERAWLAARLGAR